MGTRLYDKETYFYTLIIIVLIISYLFYYNVWDNAPIISADSPKYMEIALDMEDYHFNEIPVRTLGYPFLLNLFNSEIKPQISLYHMQLFFHFLAIFLFVVLLKNLNTHNILIYLFLFFSLIPSSVSSAAFVLTENPTQICLSLGLFSLLYFINLKLKINKLFILWIASIFFALSALIRPTYQLLFVSISLTLILFTIIYKTDKIKWLISILFINFFSIIIIGGYSIFNYNNYNYFGLTPWLGFNLSTKTVSYIEKIPDEYENIREILIKSRNSDLIKRNSSHTGKMYIWQTVPFLQQSTNLSLVELSKLMRKINLTLILENPLDYLVDVAQSMPIFWFPYINHISYFDSLIIKILLYILHFIVVSIYFLSTILLFLFLSSLLLINKNKEIFINLLNINKLEIISVALANSIIFYTMIISTFFEVGNPRYRDPVNLIIYFSIIVSIHLFNKIIIPIFRTNNAS